MAGKPRRRAMIKQLETRAADASDDVKGLTILEYVSQWVAGGGTLIRLAREISEASGEEIDRGMVIRYLQSTFGPEAYAIAMAESRPEGAHALTELAIDDADLVTHKDEVPVVKLKNDTRMWLAERWNREAFGQQKGNVNVQLNIGALHLDALRRHPIVRAEIVEASESEVEVLSAPARESIDAKNLALTNQ